MIFLYEFRRLYNVLELNGVCANHGIPRLGRFNRCRVNRKKARRNLELFKLLHLENNSNFRSGRR